jgi:hypothetical protein
MEIETKIVAFVDILGFADLIKQFDKKGNSKILDDLKEAVDTATNLIKPIPEDSDSLLFHWKECTEIKLFSDCLCMSAPLNYKGYDLIEQLEFFYKYLIGYQQILMSKNYFSRGGITIGSYSDDNIIFSGGLVEAYTLESKIAKYPRIVVSPKMLDAVKGLDDEFDILNSMFILDSEDVCFLNPFNNYTIDGEKADKIAKEQLAGIEGFLNMSFKELGEQDKRNISEHEGKSFCNKFKWLKRLILRELGEEQLEFRNYN